MMPSEFRTKKKDRKILSDQYRKKIIFHKKKMARTK